MIDTQDVNWKTHFLPDGYTTHEPVAITSVEGFIWEKLKFEKSNLTNLVHLQVLLHICKNPRTKDSKRYKVRSQNHKAIQRLDNLIFKIMESMSPQHWLISKSNILHIQVCIGFLWLHIYVQRQLDHTTSENRSHWEVIEGQLEVLRS